MAVDIQRLRDDADGARGVADGNPDVLASAANIDAAADQLQATQQQLDQLLGVVADHRCGTATASTTTKNDKRLYAIAEEIEKERKS